MAQPLRSRAITAPSSLLRVGPSLPSASVLSASVFTLAPFPLASLVRFACSVQRAWTSFTPLKRRTLRNQYLGSPLRLSQERVQPLVLVPPKRLSTLHQWFTCARLSSPYMTGLNPAFFRRVGPGDFAPRPSRPGDLHPEPLTDSGRKPLDLSGSCHPLKAAASHRDRRVPPVIPLTLFDRDAGDLLPSLLGRYPVSTLIRSSPPLGGASVLSDSWFVHLCLFPFHRQPGSQVPHESPD